MLSKILNQDDYGTSTILFDKEQTSERRAWRNRMIDDLKKEYDRLNKKGEKKESLLELKIVVGEFNIGAQDTLKYAIDKGFEIMEIVGGPKIWYDDREEISLLLSQKTTINYFSRKNRPSIHFMLLGNKHLFLERHHRHDQSRETLGIENTKKKYLDVYVKVFDLLKKESTLKTSSDVMEMYNYDYNYEFRSFLKQFKIFSEVYHHYEKGD